MSYNYLDSNEHDEVVLSEYSEELDYLGKITGYTKDTLLMKDRDEEFDLSNVMSVLTFIHEHRSEAKLK